MEKLEAEKLSLQKKIRAAKLKLRGGSAVARGTSTGARYPLKQNQSLPDIKADAGNRRNTMIFRKNIPG